MYVSAKYVQDFEDRVKKKGCKILHSLLILINVEMIMFGYILFQ